MSDTPLGLPLLVRNWLAARFLADPMPARVSRDDVAEPEPIVYARFDVFADFLMAHNLDVFATNRRAIAAGWIDDHTIATWLTSGADEPRTPHPSRALALRETARLRLGLGKHRVIGIRPAVLDAPAGSTEPTSGCRPGGEAEGGTVAAGRVELLTRVRAWAESLSGTKSRDAMLKLCDSGGGVALRELAKAARWKNANEGFKSFRGTVEHRLAEGFDLELQWDGGAIDLIPLTDETRDRLMSSKGKSK